MATKASRGKKAKGKKPGSPFCKTCRRTIRVPKGWTHGPAIRRHYWAKHRAIMQGKRRS